MTALVAEAFAPVGAVKVDGASAVTEIPYQLVPGLDAEGFFATEWRSTAQRLVRMLARHGVAPCDREDIVQETALRLYRAWRCFDDRRGADAYAHTIALNVLRDELRRPNRRRESGEDVPELSSCGDSVERVALARIEVSRVAGALKQLSATERRILATAVVDHSATSDRVAPAPSAATRMARMRARRRLESVLAAS